MKIKKPNKKLKKIDIFTKVQNAFHLSNSIFIYGREKEIQEIYNFLNSEKDCLHITGPPGTGKTSVLKYVLKKYFNLEKNNILHNVATNNNYNYLNYYTVQNLNSEIKHSTSKIIIIDEFDKYLSEKKNECIKNTLFLKRSKKKLITISNNLKITISNNLKTSQLRFLPYSSESIFNILKSKIDAEIGVEIAPLAVLKYISKKFDKIGDLRVVFKFIAEVYCSIINMDADMNSDTSASIDADMSANQITLKDCFDKKFTDFTETSIHHKIIKECSKNSNKKNAYRKYISECDKLKIDVLDFIDFGMIYELE